MKRQGEGNHSPAGKVKAAPRIRTNTMAIAALRIKVLTHFLARVLRLSFSFDEQETEQQDEPPDGGILPVIRLPMRFGFGSVHRVDRSTPGRIKRTIFAVRASEAAAASERRQTQQQYC